MNKQTDLKGHHNLWRTPPASQLQTVLLEPYFPLTTAYFLSLYLYLKDKGENIQRKEPAITPYNSILFHQNINTYSNLKTVFCTPKASQCHGHVCCMIIFLCLQYRNQNRITKYNYEVLLLDLSIYCHFVLPFRRKCILLLSQHHTCKCTPWTSMRSARLCVSSGLMQSRSSHPAAFNNSSHLGQINPLVFNCSSGGKIRFISR